MGTPGAVVGRIPKGEGIQLRLEEEPAGRRNHPCKGPEAEGKVDEDRVHGVQSPQPLTL